jgi:methionyl-tRNA synthetase
MSKYYISTSIPYVNGDPHIGHALEFVQADVLARYHRQKGDEVFFLSGTDENSLKNVRKALEKNMGVKELINQNSKRFLQLKESYNISTDDFIRTTEERHVAGVKKLWKSCEKDIYKKKYKGLYCVGCERFYKENELVDGLCPDHKKKPELIEEENYFFKLSSYSDQLKQLIKEDKIRIIPETRKNEILSVINQGLEDICISRSKERAHGWGIPVPGDSSQVVWVWFDALSNYINALGYGEGLDKFKDWWEENENKTHVIGKGIARFHALYWPGMLLSAGITLPRTIFVHAYITSEGEKMSKSLGNVVDPFDVCKRYGSEGVRYFLLREIPSFKDGDFTDQKFEDRYNADLAKGLGNLVSRVLSIAEKIEIKESVISKKDIENSEFESQIEKTQKNIANYLDGFEFNKALKSIWELVSFCDGFIEQERVWEKSENQEKKILLLIYTIYQIAQLLKSFLPETANKILSTIQIEEGKNLKISAQKTKSLFPKID